MSVIEVSPSSNFSSIVIWFVLSFLNSNKSKPSKPYYSLKYNGKFKHCVNKNIRLTNLPSLGASIIQKGHNNFKKCKNRAFNLDFWLIWKWFKNEKSDEGWCSNNLYFSSTNLTIKITMSGWIHFLDVKHFFDTRGLFLWYTTQFV